MGINVAHVSKAFGDFVALDDLSLDVPSGQLTALLGPSGGGKSTLLRIIGGLETADAGTVAIDGKDATAVPARRRDVFVFQHYAAFKHLTVAPQRRRGLEVGTVRGRDQGPGRRTAGPRALGQFADRLRPSCRRPAPTHGARRALARLR
jgi:ABC-type sulfate/molybdate transport systems ATPase subunit